MALLDGINEPQRLLHANIPLKVSLQECILMLSYLIFCLNDEERAIINHIEVGRTTKLKFHCSRHSPWRSTNTQQPEKGDSPSWKNAQSAEGVNHAL